MSNLLTSSVGKKLIMSISGCFLILFLVFHMCMNVTVLFSEEAYNMICEFLGSNWYAIAGTLVLAGGVLVHVCYALWLTIQNMVARGDKRYAVNKRSEGVSWSSKNMFVLGAIIILGMLVHFYNFWYNMMFTEIIGAHENAMGLSPTDGAGLINFHFASLGWVILYLVWFVAIWFHLTHGFWSMFQSVGWANKKWYPRLKWIGYIVVTLIMLGYASVVVVTYINSVCPCLAGACS